MLSIKFNSKEWSKLPNNVTNLFNINQLCDWDLNVKFNNEECYIIDKQHTQLMNGFRSIENCYMFSPSNVNQPQSYIISKVWETKLWTMNHGDINLISTRNISTGKSIKFKLKNIFGSFFRD